MIATPAFETTDITAALDDFGVLFITLSATLADVFNGLASELMQTSFSTIVDALFLILKQVMAVFKMLIKSGMITTVVGVGVDFVIIYFTEIAIPVLLYAIAGLMCILDLFKPGGWTDQLKCGAPRARAPPRAPHAAHARPPPTRATPMRRFNARAQSRSGASRAPTPSPTFSSSGRCPSLCTALWQSWRRRSTRARAAASSTG